MVVKISQVHLHSPPRPSSFVFGILNSCVLSGAGERINPSAQAKANCTPSSF